MSSHQTSSKPRSSNAVTSAIHSIHTIIDPLVRESGKGDDPCAVMLLERGIRDISQVLGLTRNSVYSAHSVEDTIPHVYKMEGHRSLYYLPPGSLAGDYNLHHVCVCVRVCVRVSRSFL